MRHLPPKNNWGIDLLTNPREKNIFLKILTKKNLFSQKYNLLFL